MQDRWRFLAWYGSAAGEATLRLAEYGTILITTAMAATWLLNPQHCRHSANVTGRPVLWDLYVIISGSGCTVLKVKLKCAVPVR